jgi:hypothetical protein
VAVRRFEADETTAGVVAALFGATVPLGVYGNQVYPEIVAALVALVGVAALTGSLSRRAVWLVGASVVALPWLSIKYAPVALALTGVCVARLWFSGRRRTVGVFATGLALAGAVFVITHLWWYGGITPYAAGDHFVDTGEFSVVGTNIDPLGRSRRLVGLMIDDKFGLAAWQPAWLFVVPALTAFVAAGRSAPFRRAALLAPLSAAWLNATFIALTMQGFWFPGRQVVVVLPLVVILIAAWASKGERRLASVCAIGSIGVLSLVWLLVEGYQERITWVVDFFETRNPLYRGWQTLLPDYLDVSVMTWLLQGMWMIAGLACVLWTLRVLDDRGRDEGRVR